jgi:hypothetical protein
MVWVQFFYLAFLYAITQQVLGPFPAVGSHLAASLFWGYAVCERVLAGKSSRQAFFSGPGKALRDLFLLPVRFLSWLRRPNLRSLTSGPLPLIPYFALIWMLVPVTLYVVSALGHILLSGLGLSFQLVDMLSMLLGGILGYDLAVSGSCLNYMACLSEEQTGAKPPLTLPSDSSE